LTGLIVTTGLGFIWAPIAGALSDRIGRRQMYIIGCIFVAIFTFAYFAMLDTRIPWVIFTAVALSLIPVMTMYGPEAALIAEAFAATALQRRLDWLSACFDHRRRAGTLYLDLAIRDLSLDISDRHLRRYLCDHQHHRNGAAAGLYEQGHLNRGAL
jgi:MFS family permease